LSVNRGSTLLRQNSPKLNRSCQPSRPTAQTIHNCRRREPNWRLPDAATTQRWHRPDKPLPRGNLMMLSVRRRERPEYARRTVDRELSRQRYTNARLPPEISSPKPWLRLRRQPLVRLLHSLVRRRVSGRRHRSSRTPGTGLSSAGVSTRATWPGQERACLRVRARMHSDGSLPLRRPARGPHRRNVCRRHLSRNARQRRRPSIRQRPWWLRASSPRHGTLWQRRREKGGDWTC